MDEQYHMYHANEEMYKFLLGCMTCMIHCIISKTTHNLYHTLSVCMRRISRENTLWLPEKIALGCAILMLNHSATLQIFYPCCQTKYEVQYGIWTGCHVRSVQNSLHQLFTLRMECLHQSSQMFLYCRLDLHTVLMNGNCMCLSDANI